MSKQMRVVIQVSKEAPFNMTLQHVKRRMQQLLLMEEKKLLNIDFENEFDLRFWKQHCDSRMKFSDVPCYIKETYYVEDTTYYVFEAYYKLEGGLLVWDEEPMIEHLENKMRNASLFNKILDK